MQFVQPEVMNTLVQALIGLLVLFLLAVIQTLRSKLEKWLESRTTAVQRETLHKLAGEAAALAETAYKDLGGEQKLQQACRYVIARIGEMGIEFKPETVRAAIEKAVMDYNAVAKPETVQAAMVRPEPVRAAIEKAAMDYNAKVKAGGKTDASA